MSISELDDTILEYVKKHFKIDQIFDDQDIIRFCADKYYWQNIYKTSDVISDIRSDHSVEDVFVGPEIIKAATSLYSLEELSGNYNFIEISEFIENYCANNRYSILALLDNDTIMEYVKASINLNDYLRK